jgi:hypothetical protein
MIFPSAKFSAAVAGVLMTLLATAAVAQPGEGRGGGTGRGDASGPGGEGQRQARPRSDACGSEVIVVRPNGKRETYSPAGSLFEGLEVVEIDQGDQPRSAVPARSLLARFGASGVEVTDCSGKTRHLPAGLPFEGEEYLVVTGRGIIKVVREVRPKRYANLIQRVRELQFYRSASPAAGGEQKNR